MTRAFAIRHSKPPKNISSSHRPNLTSPCLFASISDRLIESILFTFFPPSLPPPKITHAAKPYSTPHPHNAGCYLSDCDSKFFLIGIRSGERKKDVVGFGEGLSVKTTKLPSWRKSKTFVAVNSWQIYLDERL